MAAITSAAIGVAAAGAQIYQGEQAKKKAKQAMNEYERTDLDNAFDNIQISTVGSDVMREEGQRMASTAIGALQQGGSRNLLAGLPRIQSAMNSQNQQTQKYLDEQNQRRTYAVAEDSARIRGINENRDAQNLAGIGSQFSAGAQQSLDGTMGVVSGIGSLSRSIKSEVDSNDDSETDIGNAFSGMNMGSPSEVSLANNSYRSNYQKSNIPNWGYDFMNKNLFNS